jgi:hypothetical protein
MPGVGFDTAIGPIFARCETAIAERIDKARTRTEALQSQDTSRLAYTLTEVIEHEVEPAIDEALTIYDDAINRPIKPDRRYEDAMRRRIELTVDAGVDLALKLDAERHPWKPLLSEESPKLRDRLLARADQHFEELRKAKRSRRRAPKGLPEALVRLGLFAGGIVVGALAMLLIGR